MKNEVTKTEIDEFIDEVRSTYLDTSDYDVIDQAFQITLKTLKKHVQNEKVKRIYVNDLLLNIFMEMQLEITKKRNPSLDNKIKDKWLTDQKDVEAAEVADVAEQNNHARIMLAEEASDYEQTEFI